MKESMMGFGDAQSDRETEELVMVPAREVVEAVRQAAAEGDFEKAHGLEDFLRHHALGLFADGALDNAEVVALAKIVLETGKIEFERPCA